MNDSKIFSELP
jgi:hypothetical protein